MTVKQVKSLIDFLANKYQLGYISGDEFNLTFRAAEMSHLAYLLGNTHQFQPGRPIPRFGLNMTKSNTERLAPFRFTVSANSGTSGEIAKMSDVVAVEAMNRVDGVPLYYVAPNRVSEYLNSSVRDLTVDPIYTEYDTYFRTFPSSLDVVITAIRVPPITRWAYNVIDDVEVYDNTASSDPIWKPADTLEIVGRMCKLIGVSLKDGELMSYGQSIINQGE